MDKYPKQSSGLFVFVLCAWCGTDLYNDTVPLGQLAAICSTSSCLYLHGEKKKKSF